MRARVIETEAEWEGRLLTRYKTKLIGYSEHGKALTLTIEEETFGDLQNTLAAKLGTYTDIELEIGITGKAVRIERFKL